MAYKWVKVNPGTVLLGTGWRHKGQTYTIVDADTDIRYCVSEEYVGDGNYEWCINYQGNIWRFKNIKGAFTEIKIPAMKKEFVTLAVKGSEWEFERDWSFNGWVRDSGKTYTVPAGTRVKIIDSKMRLSWYAPQEKCIVCEIGPGLEMFSASSYVASTMIVGAFLPAKEVSGYLKLVTAGKAKTYWKMENSEGTAFVDKRFANIGNLKSSLRVRFGLVQPKSDDEDACPPEWTTWDGYERPDTDKGVWAVQYDHATDTVLERQDMSKFLTITFLKA